MKSHENNHNDLSDNPSLHSCLIIGRSSFDVVKFQEHIFDKYNIRSHEGQLYMFNGISYETITKEAMNDICFKELGEHKGLFTISAANAFWHFAISSNIVDKSIAKHDIESYIAMQNGLLDLISLKLMPHSSSVFCTNALPYPYSPKAGCPRFKQFLNEVFVDDVSKITFIQEAVGYAFHKGLPVPGLFMLIGEGSNGKSVFLDVLEALFGLQNISNLNMKELSDEKYVVGLANKMLNISSEQPNKTALESNRIKAIVSGDLVTGRNLYKDPTTFRPYAKHFLAMNRLPDLGDISHGMWRRIKIIEFNQMFSDEQADVYLIDKLLKELPGILCWALEGYIRLRKNGFKFKASKSMDKALSSYRSKCNSTLGFASDCLVKLDNEPHEVIFNLAYIRYLKYCKHEQLDPVKKHEFKSTLQQIGYKIEESTKRGNKVCIINGRYTNIRQDVDYELSLSA